MLQKRLMMLLGIVLVIVSSSFQVNAADTYKIATFDPMSGPLKYLGDLTHWSLQFHVDQYNKKGGVLGKKIEIIPYDSQMKPDIAVKMATRAILEDKVDAIGAGIGSHILKALGQVAKKYKVILINYGGEAASLTGKLCNPYAFRITLNTGTHSRALAAYLASIPGASKVGIIAQDYNFGRESAEDFKKALAQFRPGIEVPVEIYFPLMTKDFAPYITKLNASGVSWVFTSAFGPDMVNLIKQGNELGLKGKLLTFYLEDPFVLRDVQKAAVGHVMADLGSVANPHQKNRELLTNWNNQYRKFVKSDDLIYQWPHGSAFHTYYLGMFFDAVNKAGSFKARSIIKAWEGMRYVGMNGEVVMRAEDHQLLAPVPVIEIVPRSMNKLDPAYPGSKFLSMIPIEKATIPLEETGCKRSAGQMR